MLYSNRNGLIVLTEMFCFICFFTMVATRDTNTTLGLEIYVIKTLERENTHCGTHENETALVTDGLLDERILSNIHWKYTKTPFQLIMEATNITKDLCDVLVLYSSCFVFETVRYALQKKGILVLRWPLGLSDFPWNPIPAGVSRQKSYMGTSKQIQDDHQCGTKPTIGDKISSLVASIIKQTMTNNLYVIIQNHEESSIKFQESALDSIVSKYMLYRSWFLDTRDRVRTILQETAGKMDAQQTWCLIICDNPCIDTILTEVNKYDEAQNTGIRLFSKWLIFADEQYKPVTQRAAGNITNMQFVSISRDLHRRRCQKDEELKRILRATMCEVSCTNISTKFDIISKLEYLYKNYIAGLSNREINFQIDTLLWTANKHEFSSVGEVNENTYTKLNIDMMYPNTLYGFNKKELRMGVLPWFWFVRRNVTNGTKTYDGFCVDILEELARTLNFSYRFVEPPDGQWGKRLHGTNWTGLVGMLHNREIDMVVSPLSVDPRRLEVMAFTTPVYYTFMTGMYRKPDPNKYKWKTVLKPFRYEVFVVLLCWLPAACIIIFTLEKCSALFNKGGSKKFSKTFGDLVFYVIGTQLAQGNVQTPFANPGRSFMSFFWLFSIIMASLYSGALIAFLTVTKEHKPFSTFSELLDQDVYKWGTMGGSIYETSFSESTSEPIMSLWDGILRFKGDDPSVLSQINERHMEKMMNGEYVYLNEWNGIHDISCDLLMFEEKLYRSFWAMGLQKNSPYNPFISKRLQDIHESGIDKIWEKKWSENKEVCAESVKAESKPICLSDIQGAFYLLGVGIIVSAFILLIEMCIYRVQHLRRTTDNETEEN